MLTWLLLIVTVPLLLGLVSLAVDVATDRYCRARMERERRAADAILREWTRLGEAVDATDPEADEAVREAERIIKGAAR